MHGIHASLGALDLNLVVALDALLAERSVTRAAERVGITQSAMSHALGRLRALTGDALLVRVNNQMVATARAEALAPPIRRALEEVERALAPAPSFDPNTAQRRLVVGTSDYAELVLLPRLVARTACEAPGIDLRFVPLGEDVAGLLASGAIDLALAPLRARDEASSIFRRRLFEERFVAVVREGHPLAKKKLTIARYAAASHALISPGGTEGGLADDALERLGLKRRVAVTVPHFLVAPYVVASSDLILTLAARIAATVAAPLGLEVLALPPELRLGGFSVSAVWHERTQNDPAQRWLRDLFVAIAKTI